MIMKDFLKSLDGSIVANNISGITNLILAILLAFVVVNSMTKDEKVIVTPETLGTEAWITRDNASRSYKESWALYLAQLSGNITPQNVDFIISNLKPILSPRVYTDMVDSMNQQAIAIKEDRVTIRFEPRQVEFEEQSGKVFVYGKSFMKSGDNRERQVDRTFEYIIRIRNYAPEIMSADNYEGMPKTQLVIQAENANKSEKRR